MKVLDVFTVSWLSAILASASPDAAPDSTYMGVSHVVDDTLPAHAHQTLLPAVHWDWPVNDLRNLDPTDYVNLHYTEDGTSNWEVEHAFASMATTLRHNTVILEHSAFVQDISCTKDALAVSFNSARAFKYASRAWKSDRELVFVTNHVGCGSSNEERAFWLIDSITIDRGQKTITGRVERELKAHDTLGEVDMVWGVHKPKEDMRKRAALRRRQAQGGPVYGGNPSTTTRASTTTHPATTTTRPASTTTAPPSTSTTPRPPTGTLHPGQESGDDCGAAPAKMLDGFPAADCGSDNFDSDIDAAIGYLGFEESDWAADLKEFAPGIDFSAEELDYGVGNMRRRALTKRGIGNWVVGAVTSVGSRALNLLNKPKELLVDAVRKIPYVGKVIEGVTVYNPSVSGNQAINLGPKEDQTTPFGKGALLYSKNSAPGDKLQYAASLYCVDCGIRGNVELVGRAKFDILKLSVSDLSATITADLRAGLHLALVANASYTDSSTKQLVRQPIPKLGVAVKGIFSAGCILGVDAKTDIEVRAQGSAIAGVAMLLPNFKAQVNMLGGGDNTVTGYQPKFIRRLQINGGMSASAKLSLPISFNVGVEIPLLKATKNQGKYTISLVEAPGIKGDFAFIGGAGSPNPTQSTCYNGIEFGITLTNDVNVNLLNLKTIPIQNYSNQLVKQCFGPNQTGVPDPAEGTTVQPPVKQQRRRDNQIRQTTGDGSVEADPGDTVIVAPPGSTIVIIEDNTPEATADFADSPGSADGFEIVDVSKDSSPQFSELQTEAIEQAETAADVLGFTFSAIRDVGYGFVLYPGDDGNIYAGAIEEGDVIKYHYFGAINGVTAIDNLGRLMHYYPDEMAKFGASRIRLAEEQKIPKTADMLALRQVSVGGAAASLVAVNTLVEQQGFVLVMCNFSNQGATQLFVVNGEDGLKALVENKDLTYTIAGGPIADCGTVQLVYGFLP